MVEFLADPIVIGSVVFCVFLLGVIYAVTKAFSRNRRRNGQFVTLKITEQRFTGVHAVTTFINVPAKDPVLQFAMKRLQRNERTRPSYDVVGEQLDSLDVVELIMNIETELWGSGFSVELLTPDDETGTFVDNHQQGPGAETLRSQPRPFALTNLLSFSGVPADAFRKLLNELYALAGGDRRALPGASKKLSILGEEALENAKASLQSAGGLHEAYKEVFLEEFSAYGRVLRSPQEARAIAQAIDEFQRIRISAINGRKVDTALFSRTLPRHEVILLFAALSVLSIAAVFEWD